ncbi:XRE family transcriptional regulator [Lactonifactor longoviformis]|uniref:Transcriptional regulator, XRE family with cupin sensor n=1 Tax=Lactonifactor longoviformis DSM 17459 TaxID=1122155 RepID=A0A1M4ZVQ4_9CLOT|nr:helix-turn-helix domain-containing protein [Lactonifactor longoviformis]POP33626.1 XRE family transcriptional regulator [Lactonifactor longoviformis]SHF22133.1 transcriptional regulator, XRE family with cupin sensor [Lactonifactor longoviformis DSM 17459]
MTDFKLLGKKLKSLRKEKMLTLQQLSERSGISTGYISKIERGAVNPSVKNIQKLCFVLDITANELMIDETETEKISSTNKEKSYILRKEERLPIYGIVNALDFESVFEDSPHFKVNVLTLVSGMREQSYNVHSYDEFGIVAKGKLGLEMDDGNYELSEGDCIMIRANTKHTITNRSSEECISYWIEISK